MALTERDIRAALAIPEAASPVVFLGMDAHMDWDWLGTFQQLVLTPYIGGPGSAESIISSAWDLMIKNQGAVPYVYSVCEMGFLRAVLDLHPALRAQYEQHGLADQLALEGGGITSPDNLLPHGEAFIRNYLLGRAWQKPTLGLESTFAYLPDDFGHDAQLPIVLEAMGFSGVVFSRLPGSWGSGDPLDRNRLSLWQEIMRDGSDLFWEADDGSSVQTHVYHHGYQEGGFLKDYCESEEGLFERFQDILDPNLKAARTGYAYIPCGDDFALPIPCLLTFAEAWNEAHKGGAHLVVGSLEHYMQLVRAWARANPGKLVTRKMDPTPYWTGFYASRPANKILHQATVRALLGAEVLGTVADLLQSNDRMAWAPVQGARRQSVAQGWEALVPSTHHDYITGTAVDSVYSEEQLPLLRAAHAVAEGARSTAVEELAGLIAAVPDNFETPVLVANQLGHPADGPVTVRLAPTTTAGRAGVRNPDGTVGRFQTTDDDQVLFMGSAPGLGYDTFYLTPTSGSGETVVASFVGGVATLSNSRLRVQIAQPAAWAITNLLWKDSGGGEHRAVAPGQFLNQLVFYRDDGNIYDFGNEPDFGGLTLVNGGLTVYDGRLVEKGPLRARFQADVTFRDPQGGATADYTLEYELVAGEPFVRVSVTGAAPYSSQDIGGQGYSVMVRVPFADADGNEVSVDGAVRGTPYHWYDKLPVPYWDAPTFQATHNFVVPTARGAALGALYHADVPAWAIDAGGAMIGCILRNTPGCSGGPGRGADGIDHGAHRRGYAIRVPANLTLPPQSSMVLTEALEYSTPLLGAPINVPMAGISQGRPVDVSFPPRFSLASVTTGDAVITAAKQGQFNPGAVILRIYQQSNRAAPVTLSLAGYIQATGHQTPHVIRTTALEQPISGAQPIPVNNQSITFTAERAITTLAITPE